MDFAIAGGGVIGLACARELAGRGRQVTLYDARHRGQASWAAAGILGPQSEVHEPSPLLDLCRTSFALYRKFVEHLGDVGFRSNGTLHRAFTDEDAARLEALARWQRAAGLSVEERRDGLFFPEEGQVDNRRLVQALRADCERKGVRFSDGPAVNPSIVCGGAWSGYGVFPVKGEIIALDAKPPDCVVFGGGGYLVPRGDVTLVGATSERRADLELTKSARDSLLAVAAKHGYGGARVVDHWAGLRPATEDGLPLLGRAGDLIVATGHYRNGILLAPITAKIVAALVEDGKPPVDLAPFDPLRYSARPSGRHP
ncbi:MAG: NAD(P)/FAD-dependent oxidoreductase [Myxococcales bacterium]|nr:FAD-dependent oxidoreductase [Myxococcales bacterium]